MGSDACSMMTAFTMRLTFKETPDDYEVLDNGQPIGRIYYAVNVQGPSWFWVYWKGGATKPQSEHDKGFAETLEAAKEAFKARLAGEHKPDAESQG